MSGAGVTCRPCPRSSTDPELRRDGALWIAGLLTPRARAAARDSTKRGSSGGSSQPPRMGLFRARRRRWSNNPSPRALTPPEPQKKGPGFVWEPGARRFWQRPTLAPPHAALPSGLRRFTAVFGMETGGATALSITRALAKRKPGLRARPPLQQNLWRLLGCRAFPKDLSSSDTCT